MGLTAKTTGIIFSLNNSASNKTRFFEPSIFCATKNSNVAVIVPNSVHRLDISFGGLINQNFLENVSRSYINHGAEQSLRFKASFCYEGVTQAKHFDVIKHLMKQM